jgi:hypothetical protein
MTPKMATDKVKRTVVPTMVESNGGLHNTIAMEYFDKGYRSLSTDKRDMIDRRVDELGLCPKCGEKPTYQTPDGTFWDSSAHHWRKAKGKLCPTK